jgi:hypothetical protein
MSASVLGTASVKQLMHVAGSREIVTAACCFVAHNTHRLPRHSSMAAGLSGGTLTWPVHQTQHRQHSYPILPCFCCATSIMLCCRELSHKCSPATAGSVSSRCQAAAWSHCQQQQQHPAAEPAEAADPWWLQTLGFATGCRRASVPFGALRCFPCKPCSGTHRVSCCRDT